MEAQEKHLAIVRGNLQERKLDGLLVFPRDEKLQRRSGAIVGRLEGLAGFWVCQLFETGEFLAAGDVDDQMARNGEEPGFEFGFRVVLAAALEHANPGFLEEVFGESWIAGEEKQVTIEALLILLDEAIEKVRIAAAKAISQGLAFVSHEAGEEYRRPWNRKSECLCAHTNVDTDELGKKTQEIRK